MANWGELPQDLLNLVIEKLGVIDHISFSSVNTIWRSTGLEYRRKKIPTNIPGLIIPGGTTPATQTRRFLDHQKILTVDNKSIDGQDLPVLSVPHVRLCRGSYRGWLVLIDNSMNMYLYNPYFKSRIDLPRVSKLPFYNVTNSQYVCVNKWYVHKIILSASPVAGVGGGEVCYAVAIYRHGVAFCTIGDDDKDWRAMEFTREWAIPTFSDGVFYQGKFYLTNNAGRIFVADLTSPCPKLSQLGGASTIAGPTGGDITTLYLVEIDGDLFKILKENEYEEVEISKEDAAQLTEIDRENEPPVALKISEDNDKYRIDEHDYDNVFFAHLQGGEYHTVGFAVFKWESNGSEQKWAPVEHLNGAAVFLGYKQSWALLGDADSMAGYERDTIYYTDDNAQDERFSLRSGLDMGVFRLRDSSFRPLYVTDSRSLKPHAVWFTPTLT